MKYWNFDVCQLIADYERNKKTLAAIQDAVEVAERYLDNPVGATTRGDWQQYLQILYLRRSEYDMYVNMVYRGFSDLPEVERKTLEWWLIGDYPDDVIISNLGIANLGELKKIKKIALTKFTNIVMPN